MVPSKISGCPNCAFSPAKIMSHIMANSQPPPSYKEMTGSVVKLLALLKIFFKMKGNVSLLTANPFTAAITGFLTVDTLFQCAKKLPLKHS